MFLPTHFPVPETLETEAYRLRMLSIHDVVKDYDAVMTSCDRIQGVFGPSTTWPVGLTFEQDLIDLGWHQKEFQRGTSFTYTVMSLDESRCLGCVYFYPSPKQGYEAMAILWVRTSHAELDGHLFETVKGWLSEAWPFKQVAFPGRELNWDEWLALPDL
ncbi:MAG: GNAT family N-acetyltransferase [Cyanobacteria bacterium P01_A01_bin.114]